jgi:hypothetical protein
MFKLVKILTVLCLCSCYLGRGKSANDAFLFDSDSGLIVYNYSGNNIDINEIKKTIECVADFMGADKSLIGLLTVTVSSDNMVFCWDNKKHFGCYHRFQNSIAIGGNQRLEMLQHEIKHWSLEMLTGDADQKHKNKVFDETISCIE